MHLWLLRWMDDHGPVSALRPQTLSLERLYILVTAKMYESSFQVAHGQDV